jgi:signal transduction histidine kinase
MLLSEVETSAAQEQSRLKSVFLGTVSLELCTPLNAIIADVDTLCSKPPGSLGASGNEETVRNIRSSAQRLSKAVNNLIEIARIEAASTDSGDDRFDISLAAEKAIHAVHERAQLKNITITLNKPKEAVTGRGSMPSLAQAIERLLCNAIRYSRDGGRVVLAVAQSETGIQINVIDQGEGISQERLAELDRPFSAPTDNGAVAGRNGLRFGIPIAKGLVQLMGGTVTITSKEGAGTDVCIRLPANPTTT